MGWFLLGSVCHGFDSVLCILLRYLTRGILKISKCVLFLPTTLSHEVMQSPPSSICPSVFTPSFEPTDLWPWSLVCVSWYIQNLCMEFDKTVLRYLYWTVALLQRNASHTSPNHCLWRVWPNLSIAVVTRDVQCEKNYSTAAIDRQTQPDVQSTWVNRRVDMITFNQLTQLFGWTINSINQLNQFWGLVDRPTPHGRECTCPLRVLTVQCPLQTSPVTSIPHQSLDTLVHNRNLYPNPTYRTLPLQSPASILQAWI